VTAAAKVINRDGYDGTDSNRIAKEAGYAAGTFYKHFRDKKEIFLAVYEEWVAKEWRDISAMLASGDSPRVVAKRIVEVFVGHHVRWAGFRASLRALVPTDPDVRTFARALRRRQLALLRRLVPASSNRYSEEDNVLLLLTLERAADAIADGETAALGLRDKVFRSKLEALVLARLVPDA
jgi:AcrR family transcriptional regulator